MPRRKRRPRQGEQGATATEQAYAEQAQYPEVAYGQSRTIFSMYAARPLYSTVHYLGYVPATIDEGAARRESISFITSPSLPPPSDRISPTFELTDEEAEDRALARKRRRG